MDVLPMDMFESLAHLKSVNLSGNHLSNTSLSMLDPVDDLEVSGVFPFSLLVFHFFVFVEYFGVHVARPIYLLGKRTMHLQTCQIEIINKFAQSQKWPRKCDKTNTYSAEHICAVDCSLIEPLKRIAQTELQIP